MNANMSAPFPLFTEECVKEIYDILHNEDIKSKCVFTSEIAPYVYRGLCKYSQFVKDLWTSPHIENIASSIMKTNVKYHPMLYERGHCNISMHKSKKTFDWHYDSQPYVLIVLLSTPPCGDDNCTFYKDCDNNVCSLSFPKAGYARILKGSTVEHCVNANYEYRTTMITSLVSDMHTDYTNLDYAKTYTPQFPLYTEYVLYRLSNLKNIINESLDSEEQRTKALHEINMITREFE